MEAPTTPVSADERNMALILYILSIFAGFISGLVFLLVKRDSKFISFHALQVIFWHIFFVVMSFAVVVMFFVAMFVVSFASSQAKGPPVGIFLLFPMFWLTIIAGWSLNALIGIVFAIKANRGEWPAIPVIGQFARKFADI